MRKTNGFRFKQFEIQQDKCAMKVGTDGVLLGAWTRVIDAKSVLDIGSGTGLVSLMLAQRSQAEITAIDIDCSAFEQTCFNFNNSPWKNRLTANHLSIQAFAKVLNTRFCHIVSNPPFYENSYKPSIESVSIAKHTTTLSFSELIDSVSVLLTETGLFSVIIPYDVFDRFDHQCRLCGLYTNRITHVRPLQSKPIIRVLVEYSKKPVDVVEASEIVIEYSRHNYTKEYIALTKDFYLKM